MAFNTALNYRPSDWYWFIGGDTTNVSVQRQGNVSSGNRRWLCRVAQWRRAAR